MDMFNKNSRSSEMDKLVYAIQGQALRNNLSILTIANLLVKKGVFSDDEFGEEFKNIEESCPDIVEGINTSLDSIKVIDILKSKQKFTDEDKEFLKQYGEKQGWEESFVDNLVEKHDSTVDLNEGWSKIFGDSFDSMF